MKTTYIYLMLRNRIRGVSHPCPIYKPPYVVLMHSAISEWKKLSDMSKARTPYEEIKLLRVTKETSVKEFQKLH
jgi:hypothetical protein